MHKLPKIHNPAKTHNLKKKKKTGKSGEMKKKRDAEADSIQLSVQHGGAVRVRAAQRRQWRFFASFAPKLSWRRKWTTFGQGGAEGGRGTECGSETWWPQEQPEVRWGLGWACR